MFRIKSSLSLDYLTSIDVLICTAYYLIYSKIRASQVQEFDFDSKFDLNLIQN